jgi:hypothetical protein
MTEVVCGLALALALCAADARFLLCCAVLPCALCCCRALPTAGPDPARSLWLLVKWHGLMYHQCTWEKYTTIASICQREVSEYRANVTRWKLQRHDPAEWLRYKREMDLKARAEQMKLRKPTAAPNASASAAGGSASSEGSSTALVKAEPSSSSSEPSSKPEPGSAAEWLEGEEKEAELEKDGKFLKYREQPLWLNNGTLFPYQVLFSCKALEKFASKLIAALCAVMIGGVGVWGDQLEGLNWLRFCHARGRNVVLADGSCVLALRCVGALNVVIH